MRIGIDAREIAGRPTGVGRYLAGLLNAWGRAPAGHEFVLYAAEPIAHPLDGHAFRSRIVEGARGTWWEQVRLPSVAAADHLDVFFSPAYSAPLRLRVPVVVAMHDLSFFAHPEWFRRREGLRRRVLGRRAADRAAAVVTISEFSKGEILERLHVEAAKVHVIPPGVDAPGSRAHSDGDPRVLYVGSIFNRRHVPDLIAGVCALARRRPAVSLDIVGDNRSYPAEDLDAAAAACGVPTIVRRHEYVDETALSALYGRARAFAFLSEYEGLGLTPLEALACGIPPLVLDTPVARESCGAAATYVRDTRAETIVSALEPLLFDEAIRAGLLAEAPRVLARYDWPRAARETLTLLESVAR